VRGADLQYVGDDELIRSVFLQLLDGIAHIHSLGIAHRDIKPENIVCSDDGLRVRICDFGLATSESQSSEFGCGSTFYIAPECLGESYPARTSYPTKAGDVWSLGIILVNLVCGRNPWRIASPSDDSFSAFCKDTTFLRRILPISSECLEVLEGIFATDPAKRVSLGVLRKQILRIKSFSMTEAEVRQAHAAAHAQQAKAKQAGLSVEAVEEESEDESEEEEEEFEVEIEDTSSWTEGEDEDMLPFDLEDADLEEKLPSLRADSGSPSPAALQSRSSSAMSASLPPTPLLAADPGLPTQLEPHSKAWADLFHQPPSSLRIQDPAYLSPEPLAAGGPNPFFR
jgi:serine/threonine protein kinase